MIIADEKECQMTLSGINYYRFTGYALQFRRQPTQSNYIEGVTFDAVYQIYRFDEELRDILRKYLEKAEIFYRTQISYGFSMKKCLDPPHSQHYQITCIVCQY